MSGKSIRRALGALFGVAGVAILAGCAPRLQPPSFDFGEPKLMGHEFRTRDGLNLPVRIWLPDGEPEAVILALHGFNDYANAFLEPANYLRRSGIATYAYDQRGFGATPHTGLWPGTTALTDDTADFMRVLRRRYPETPLYLLGDSMGGAAAIVTAASDPSVPIDGLVLVAPAVWSRDTMNVFQSGLLWLSAHTLPWVKLSGRGLGIRPSDNYGMLRALSRDPLVLKDARIDTLWGLTNLMDEAMADADKLHMPVLVLYGNKDEVIPKDPVMQFLERLLPSDAGARAAFYPKGYHMLLRDLKSDIVLDDIAVFAADPQAPLPSGAATRGAVAQAGR